MSDHVTIVAIVALLSGVFSMIYLQFLNLSCQHSQFCFNLPCLHASMSLITFLYSYIPMSVIRKYTIEATYTLP